jgi:hypothetical protein
MTDQIDCRWIENNLEPLFCDRLDQEQTRRARAHIDGCDSCRSEVQALNAIDPLVQKHFRRELEIAQRPRAVHTRRIFGLSTAALALVAILAFVALRAPQTPAPTATTTSAVIAQTPPVAEVQSSDAVKDPGTVTTVERAKPANAVAISPDRVPSAQPASSEKAPDFLVTDVAGYAHRVEDYRGHVVVVAVWSGASPEAVANFQRLYEMHGSNSKFRFAGVSNERLAKPQSVTFPIFYNRGSKLFGAKSGEFVLLDENGGIALRGSLTKDFDTLQKALQGN